MDDGEDKKTVPVRQDSEEAGAPISKTPEDAVSARRFKWRAVAMVLLAAVIFAGGAMLFPMLEERLPNFLGAGPERDSARERLGPIEGRLAALEAKLPSSNAAVDALRDRVEALENLPPMEAISDEGLARRTARLEQDIAALQGAPGKGIPGKFGLDGELAEEARRLRADLDALIGRVDKHASLIEELTARPTSKALDAGIALSMALSELRRQVDSGGPYKYGLAQLQGLVAADGEGAANVTAALMTLAEHADAGVATLQMLEARLAPAADAAITAEPQEDQEWWRQAWRKLSGLVKVRRVGDAPGYEPDAIAARATQRLEEGDVAGAAREIRSLEDLAPEAAAWASAAENHVAARAALDDLERASFAAEEISP